ncbi:MAG TPA: peptidylprolyl isomerase [Thermoanaerobaculia bacterium]|nr:peptidylprolyl isomerase [Thermoanaerobaculia bacterium]
MKKGIYSLLAAALVAVTAATATMAQAPASKPAVKAKPAAKKAKGVRTMSYYKDKVVDVKTGKGTITIRFFPDTAPNHVKNFIDLAEKGFYNGTKFHRVIPGFMIQGGDPNTVSGSPNTWGMGGAPKNVNAEFNNIHHARGIVSMARSNDPDSASSQFFICVADAPSLDKLYSVFGQVTKGMEVADEIVNAPCGVNDRPNQPVAIISITVRAATAEEKALPAPAKVQ